MTTFVPQLPALEPDSEFYWRSGKDGKLRILRCDDCDLYLHPPRPVCRRCLSRSLTPAVASGQGVLLSFTVNHQQWWPQVPVPYVIGLVELPEQKDMRLITRLVGVDVDDVAIGMSLRVVFEQHGEIWLPFFQPDEVSL